MKNALLTPSRRRAAAFGLVSLVCAVFVVAASANHNWRKFHWARTSNPFTVKLGNNLSSGWSSYLTTAASDWDNGSSVLDTDVVAGQSNSSCAPTMGRVEVCNANYGNTGWLGIASVWASGSHITQGTVKNNDYYFNQPRYDTPAWRLFVTCQEVGHTFGLDHQDERFNNINLGSCMDYTNDPSGKAGTNGTLNNEHPNAHDYNQLATIYSHVDGSTTVGQQNAAAKMPPAALDIIIEGPGQWGKLVRGGREQGWSDYELDFGGGHRVITHVIWASEEHQ
ncbi:MAG TPA: hypothetical protein VF064_19175 [Pyrinomonadaceae bacterium]